jgi:hypothetical protein
VKFTGAGRRHSSELSVRFDADAGDGTEIPVGGEDGFVPFDGSRRDRGITLPESGALGVGCLNQTIPE